MPILKTLNENNQWVEILGSGGGVFGGDADTLDGKHASDFALAGYGLGTDAVNYTSAEDNDTTAFFAWLDSQLARLAANSSMFVSFSVYPAISGTTYFGALHKYKTAGNYAVLEARTYNGRGLCIMKQNGEWIIEWENPPMEVGVEYRTTERWNGEAVYTQLISVGALISNGTKMAPWDVPFTSIIRLEGIAYASTHVVMLPQGTGSAVGIYVYVDSDGIWVAGNANAADFTSCYVTLYYTKD